MPLLPYSQGGPGRGHKGEPSTAKYQPGSSRYLVNRIARDRPDILEQMKAGAFTSVQEAARAAGINREGSVVSQVLRLWQKATPTEQQAIRDRIDTGEVD